MRRISEIISFFLISLFLYTCDGLNLYPEDAGDIEITVYGGNGNSHSFIHNTQFTMESSESGNWSFSGSAFFVLSPGSNPNPTNLVDGNMSLGIVGFPGRGQTENFIIDVRKGKAFGRKTIVQDNLDGLRQEYYDIGEDLALVPAIIIFTQEGPSPQYSDLVDRDIHNYGQGYQDVETWHEWWILGLLNQHANDIDNAVILTLRETAGYRCPVGNQDAGSNMNSKHIMGRAMDFNQNYPTRTSSGSYDNYIVFVAAFDFGARGWSYLVDENGNRSYIRNYGWNITAFPDTPPNGDYWIQGHVEWPVMYGDNKTNHYY